MQAKLCGKKSYFFNKMCASISHSHTPSLKLRWRQISHATIYQKCFISFKTHLIYSTSIISLILLRNILFNTCMNTNTYILFSLHQRCLFLKIHSFMNVYHQGIQYVHMPLKMFSYTNIVFKNNKMRCLLPNKWSMRKFNNDWGTSNKCNKKK